MKKLLSLILVALLVSSGNLFAKVHYVAPNDTGKTDATSWENASSDLQFIMDNAAEGDSVFVAAGTYVPKRKADDTRVITEGARENAFVLRKDVHLFGGFAGDETSFEQRDWRANETVLSGKLNDDTKTYHVMISAGDVGRATVDGFKITEANADDPDNRMTVNGIGIKHKDGAGININNGSSPVIRNCTITLNDGVGDGGGIFVNWEGSNPLIENVIVDNNTANGGGGIMVYQKANPTIINSLVINNAAYVNEGGGMRVFDADAQIVNCTVAYNTGAIDFGGVFANKAVHMNNTIVWANSGNNQFACDVAVSSVNYCLVENQNPAGNKNLNGREVMPDFVDMDNGDYTLQETSVCIDRGDNEVYHAAEGSQKDKDLAGNARIAGNSIDMGAYECQTLVSALGDMDKIDFSFYPNPAKEFICLRSVPEKSDITLTDMNGKTLLQTTSEGSEVKLDLDVPNGMYLINISNESKQGIMKFVVE